MSELDRLLIKLAKDQETDPTNLDQIPFSNETPIKKVAFDMYKVFGDRYNGLWKLEERQDGAFLVRSSHPEYGRKEAGDWSAISNHDCDIVTLSYKNVPISSFSSEEYGFTKDDVFTFKTALLDMAKEDPSFVTKVVDTQLESKATALKSVFPDLFKNNKE